MGWYQPGEFDIQQLMCAFHQSLESSFTRRHRHQLSGGTIDDIWRGRHIANLIIARNLDLAPEQVQIQALEVSEDDMMTSNTDY